MAGTWAPYTGAEPVLLAALLLAIAAVFAYLGLKLRAPVAPKRPGKATTILIVLIWIISLVAFFVDSITYGWVLKQANLVVIYQSYTAPNPITPITELGAVATFIIILFLTRKHGFKLALLSAFVGAISAPMIFELPFDLIVLNRIYPPIPPAPFLFRLLFFLPLFLIELSTISFLTFSALTRLSKHTLFSAATFFVVFAVWAAFGFGYPSDPLNTAFNDISKVLCFVVTITLFLGDRVTLGLETSPPQDHEPVDRQATP
jgi:hypothetical protein